MSDVPKAFDSGESERRGRITRQWAGTFFSRGGLGRTPVIIVGCANLPAIERWQESAQEDCHHGGRAQIVSAVLGHAAR